MFNRSPYKAKGRFVTSDSTGHTNSREANHRNVQIGTEQFLNEEKMVGTVPFVIVLPNLISLLYFILHLLLLILQLTAIRARIA